MKATAPRSSPTKPSCPPHPELMAGGPTRHPGRSSPTVGPLADLTPRATKPHTTEALTNQTCGSTPVGDVLDRGSGRRDRRPVLLTDLLTPGSRQLDTTGPNALLLSTNPYPDGSLGPRSNS